MSLSFAVDEWKLLDLYPYLTFDCPLQDNNYLAFISRIICDYIGCKYEFVSKTFFKCHQIVQNIENDLIISNGNITPYGHVHIFEYFNPKYVTFYYYHKK